MDVEKYRSLFVEEGMDHLAEMSRAAATLEKRASPDECGAAIDCLFRMAHSIKGMAASLEYAAPEELAHKLEDWMASKKVAPILAKDFVDVKIDIDRMIGGKDLISRFRPEGSSGIPWFAFLSPEGKTIATSEGAKGNLGCPYTKEEIAAFKLILAKVAHRITPKELDLITSKLGRVRSR